VTGDPSETSRASRRFNDNGQRARGDLKRRARALLDPRRAATSLDAGYGSCASPVRRCCACRRHALGRRCVRPDRRRHGAEPVLRAVGVNYYPPDYVVPGTAAMGPELAIQNSSTFINRENAVNTLASAPRCWRPTRALRARSPTGGAAAVAGDIERARRPVAAAYGTMPAAMRSGLAAAVNAVPATDTLNRAKTAYYLVVTVRISGGALNRPPARLARCPRRK
jgi:hypothetical protein